MTHTLPLAVGNTHTHARTHKHTRTTIYSVFRWEKMDLEDRFKRCYGKRVGHQRRPLEMRNSSVLILTISILNGKGTEDESWSESVESVQILSYAGLIWLFHKY